MNETLLDFLLTCNVADELLLSTPPRSYTTKRKSLKTMAQESDQETEIDEYSDSKDTLQSLFYL